VGLVADVMLTSLAYMAKVFNMALYTWLCWCGAKVTTNMANDRCWRD